MNDIQINNKEYPYCKKCFKQNIFNYIFNHKQNVKDPIEYFFNKHKDIIDIYNSNFTQKIDKTIILNHIKNKECIFNEDCYKEKKSKLPCGCFLCSHLNEFFKQFEFERRLICLCSKEYQRYEMFNLGILFFEKNNEKVSKKIINYFQERAKKNCCICNTKFNSNNHFKYVKFICPELKEKIAKDFFSSFMHIVCGNCMNINLSKVFICNICYLEHILDISLTNK